MKRFLSILILISTIALFASCGQDNDYEPYDPEPYEEATPQSEYEPTPEPTPEPELEEHISSIPIDEASRLISLMYDIFDEDDGELWGINLTAPFMFADPEINHFVANQQNQHGSFELQGDVYVGVLHEDQFITNRSRGIGGMLWGMMRWHDIENVDVFTLQTMINMVFQVVQRDMFNGRPQGIDYHFVAPSFELRVFAKMEVEALLRAVHSETEAARLEAINEALSIRNERRARVLLSRMDREYEIVVGLGFYTSLMLTFDFLEERIYVINLLAEDISRSNAATILGALYGFLLDDLGADWKTGISFETNLGYLLQEATSIEELIPFDELDLERLGYYEISAQETARIEEITRRQDAALDAIHYAFNHQPVLHLGTGIVDDYVNRLPLLITRAGYPYWYWYGELIALITEAGQLTLQNGGMRRYFLETREMEFAVSAKDMVIEESRAFGHSWELELNDGFEIVEIMGGHFATRRARD